MPRSTNKASKAKRTGECHVCGETGHYALDCKERKSDPEEVVLQDTTRKCHVCGETGHYARECKDKKSKKVVLKVIIASGTQSEKKDQGWYLNYGSSVHVCYSKDIYVDYNPMKNREVILPNNEHVDVAGIGTVVIRLDTDKVLTLSETLHIPKISKCYVSIAKLDDLEYNMSFVRGLGIIMKSHKGIGVGYNVGDGVYRLSLMGDPPLREMISNEHPGAEIANKSDLSFSFGGGQCVVKQGGVVVKKGYRDDVLYKIEDVIEEPPALAKEGHQETGLLFGNEHPELTKAGVRGWYVLASRTMHVCNSRDMFADYQPATPHEVVLEDDSRVGVVGYGTVKLQLTTGTVLTLKKVFHMPSINKCCISGKMLKEMGFSLDFDAEGCHVKKGDQIVGSGFVEDGLFRLGVIDERAGENQA